LTAGSLVAGGGGDVVVVVVSGGAAVMGGLVGSDKSGAAGPVAVAVVVVVVVVGTDVMGVVAAVSWPGRGAATTAFVLSDPATFCASISFIWCGVCEPAPLWPQVGPEKKNISTRNGKGGWNGGRWRLKKLLEIRDRVVD
jgi:uncharacterized membrane protein YhaH (DUF805 family)